MGDLIYLLLHHFVNYELSLNFPTGALQIFAKFCTFQSQATLLEQGRATEPAEMKYSTWLQDVV